MTSTEHARRPRPTVPSLSVRMVMAVAGGIILGLVGLYGLEVHCSDQAVQHAAQTVLTAPDEAPIHHVAQVEMASQQSVPTAGGDLLLCALVATCIALLFAVVAVRRPGVGWLVPARRFRLTWPSLPALLPASSIAITPLRC